MEKIYNLIRELGEKYNCSKITLFGSRARGDNRHNSDIDLAIYGLDKSKQAFFWYDIDDLPTLIKFDLVYISENTDKSLLENIDKDGVVIYEQHENL